MNSRVLCASVWILIALWVGIGLAQSQSQAVELANQAKTILDSAKTREDYV